jgi:hypothetical protein
VKFPSKILPLVLVVIVSIDFESFSSCFDFNLDRIDAETYG